MAYHQITPNEEIEGDATIKEQTMKIKKQGELIEKVKKWKHIRYEKKGVLQLALQFIFEL